MTPLRAWGSGVTASPAMNGTMPFPRSSRDGWMDTLRGGAVLLVITFHAATLMRYADTAPPGPVAAVNEWLAPFRIPMLMLLSGLLVPRSLRKGAGRYLDGKLRAVAWPYVVWVAVYVVVSWPPGGDLTYARGSYLGGTWLWYLAFLLGYYLAALVLQRVPSLVVAAGALVVSVLAPDGSKFGERLFLLFAVFMIGVWLGKQETTWQRLLTARAPLLVAGALLVVSYGTLLATGADLRYAPHVLVTSLSGVLLLVRLARAATASRTARLLAVCGRHSIVFYTVHFPVVYVAAHLLLSTSGPGGAGSWGTYLLLLALGVGVPAAFAVVLERWPRSPLRWAFRWSAFQTDPRQ